MTPILLLFCASVLAPPVVADHTEARPVHEVRFSQTDGPAIAISVIGKPTVQLSAGVQELAEGHSHFRIRVQMLFTGLTLAFALLHLILFLFLPGLRSNLFFALFLFAFAVALFFDFQHLITGNVWEVRMHRAFLSLSLLFSLRFFYELFLPEPPRQFWFIATGLLATGILATIEPQANFKYLIFMSLVQWVEVIRVDIQAIRRNQEGAWIIAAGFGGLVLFGVYDFLLDAELMGSIYGIDNAYQFGLVGLFIATSIYLAQAMARTNEQLLIQERRGREREVQQLLLEAEIARTTRELEEARALQLSMLPKTLPSLPTIDIAVHMQTATEVGGDYYDFHLAPDDTLTVSIGDATGHGLKAGMMVAIAKSMFKAAVNEPDILQFFESSTRVLKQMDLGNLYMGLTVLRLCDRFLTVSAAGMPPILIFRKQSHEVETVTLKGMPLGAFQGFPYQRYQTTLRPGDTVLLMTDGLTELFNSQREMMGLARIQRLFQEVASQSPEDVITHLREAGSKWRGQRPQDDDITLVILKALGSET